MVYDKGRTNLVCGMMKLINNDYLEHRGNHSAQIVKVPYQCMDPDKLSF